MKIKVMIVDDHTIVRDGLRSILANEPDFDIVGGAATGYEAVQRVKTLQPDVVVMDISMPQMSGFIATQKLLEAWPSAAVIILSMLGTSEQVYQAIKSGARGYLLKESAGREVVEAVRQVAAGNKYFSQPVLSTLVSNYVFEHEHSPSRSPLESLSQRENEILAMVLAGDTSAQIAESLNLSQKTVESYRSRMMQKLGVSDITGLIKFAIQNGLLPLN